MARARNSVDTIKLHLSTTLRVIEALEALTRTGRFGKIPSEVGEKLMHLKLHEIELNGGGPSTR